MTTPRDIDRRNFLKHTAAGIGAAGIAGSSLSCSEKKSSKQDKKPPTTTTTTEPEAEKTELIHRNENRNVMTYERLGRTNYACSRVVAGWIREKNLLRRLFANGVNYFDNARGYGEYEVNAREFLQKHRDEIWITSKATDIAGHGRVDPTLRSIYLDTMKDYLGELEDENLLNVHQQAVKKQKETGEKPDLRKAGDLIAKMYLTKLDESLERMGIEDVDCYMVHGIEIPWIFDCIELWEAYEKAHKAGKVKHFGFSTHKHQKEVLAAAVEANEKGPWKIDLIMPGVNPGSFDNLKDELDALKKQDVGMVAMKTTGIANRPVDQREAKFNSLMGGEEYNEWERAKLWMLHVTEGLIDSVIAGVDNVDQMKRTLALTTVKLSKAAERELKAIVKLERFGSCTSCGHCDTNCPEQIAVADMLRYHAYIHQYNDKEMARELYAQAGYDPGKVCTRCGHCADVCPNGVAITDILAELSQDMA